ncbi:MAG TPA: AAA family ATPase [Conexibacter sp.]|nr:AAA family ATPase [Conexibacter sp.]
MTVFAVEWWNETFLAVAAAGAGVVVAVIGIVAGAMTLKTARINRQTALVGREAQLAEQTVSEATARPEVLLPSRLRPFVDRVDVIDHVVAQIGVGERVVAIEGNAGVGKSAVAVELAHRLRDRAHPGALDLREHHFIWVDGRNACPTLAEICQQITLLTGNQSLASVADSTKLDALRAHLAQHRTVLLLDDVKVASSAAEGPLRQLLRTVPDGSLVIAALNGPHTLDGMRITVHELRSPHALELIELSARRLGLADTGIVDPAFARRLHAAVGGNPHLIESFVRKVQSSPEPIERLLRAVERGEGLRDPFLPAWEGSGAEARAVLVVCAALDGQAITEQLTFGSGLSERDVVRALEELMGSGLVTVVRAPDRPERFVCPYALRQFVKAEIAPAEIAAIASRLAAFYVKQFSDEPENAFWAVPHVAAITAVLELLFDHGLDADVQRVFSSSLDIFYTLGLFDARISTAGLAHRSAVRVGNHRAASLAMDVLSSTHAARGEIGAAREAVALGLIAAEAAEDPGERARQMRAHALVLYKAGRAAEALTAMEGAEELARQTGELEIVVNLLGLQTVAHWYVGAFEASAAAARRGLRVCEQMGWERAKAYPLRNLAEVAIHAGDWQEAERLLRQARALSVALGDRRQITRIHLTGARLLLLSGRSQAAVGEAEAAVSEAAVLGLAPELCEARAIFAKARRATLLAPVRWACVRARRPRFTDAAIGGD